MKNNIAARVVANIRYFVILRREEIWTRRDQLEVAQNEFQRLKNDGIIESATFRPDYSCNGSANFLVKYPS